MATMLVRVREWTGEELISFRQKYALTQEMLSQATGINIATIKQAETGYVRKTGTPVTLGSESRRKMERFANTGVPLVQVRYINPVKPVTPLRLDVLSVDVLSPAELDVSKRIAEGKSNHSIALERGTSVDTVHSQVQSIARKLGYVDDGKIHSRVMIALQYQKWAK